MNYYDIAAHICGEKWAKKRLKKMQEIDDSNKSHDLPNEKCITAACALRSEAEYSVQSHYSIGALVISCLSLFVSVNAVIISFFYNGENSLFVGILLTVLSSLGGFFAVYTLIKACIKNSAYRKARILEDSLRLLKKDGLFRKDGQKEENELTKRSETL